MISMFSIKNFHLKMIAFIISLLFFSFVNIEGSSSVNVDFRINYLISKDKIIVNTAPSKVSTTLKGAWARFRTFDINSIKPVIIDLRNKEPGFIQHRILIKHISPPAGLTVLEVFPSEIEIEIERQVEREVLVEIDPLGRLSFGYEIADVQIKPKSVKVSGPQRKMKLLDFIYTRPVDLNHRSENLTIKVGLKPPLPPLRIIEDNSVQVFIDVREEIVQRNFTLRIEVKNKKKYTRIDEKTVNVSIKGPRRIIDKIKNDELSALVDAKPEVAGVKEFEKKILIPNLPEKAQIVGNVPSVKVYHRYSKLYKKRKK